MTFSSEDEDSGGSIESLQAIKQIEPLNVDHRIKLAYALYSSGQRLEAKLEAEEIDGMALEDTVPLYKLVKLHRALRSDHRAIKICEGILLRNPRLFCFRREIIEILLKRLEFVPLRIHLERGGNQELDSANNLTEISYFYHKTSEYFERSQGIAKEDMKPKISDAVMALSWAKMALELAPENPLIKYRLAEAEFRVGNKSQALKILLGILKDKDLGADLLIQIAELLDNLGKKKITLPVARRALEATGLIAATKLRVAKLVFDNGGIREARSIVADIEIHKIDNLSTLFVCYELFFDMGDNVVAGSICKKILALDPENEKGLRWWATLNWLNRHSVGTPTRAVS